MIAFTPGLLVIGLGLGVMLPPRSTSCSRASPNRNRARSPASRAASPTSAHRSAPRSPARSSSRTSPPARTSYVLAMVSLAALALIGLAAAISCPPTPSSNRARRSTPPPQHARHGGQARVADPEEPGRLLRRASAKLHTTVDLEHPVGIQARDRQAQQVRDERMPRRTPNQPNDGGLGLGEMERLQRLAQLLLHFCNVAKAGLATRLPLGFAASGAAWTTAPGRLLILIQSGDQYSRPRLN